MTIQELAAMVPSPKVRALMLQEMDSRRLSMACAITELFRLGPDPGTGAGPGITEEEMFASLEKLHDLQSISYDTPLPIVRRANRI